DKCEQYLDKIGKQDGSQKTFMDNIQKFVRFLIDDAPEKVSKLENLIEQNKDHDQVGNCPSCDGFIVDKGTFYGCSGYHDGCKFTLPKKWVGRKLTENELKQILNNGKTGLIKRCKRKEGKRVDDS